MLFRSLQRVRLSRCHLEDEFVVYLQQHARGETFAGEAGLDVQHRQLDDVGGRSLDGGVQRHPLGHFPALTIRGVEVGQVPPTPQDRLGETRAPRLRDDAAQVVADMPEPFEVLLHQAPGLADGDLELTRQAECGQTVGEPVVHRLDLGTHRAADRIRSNPEHACGHGRVEVRPGGERLDQADVTRRVGHDPHLDLAVVGREQGLVPL